MKERESREEKINGGIASRLCRVFKHPKQDEERERVCELNYLCGILSLHS